MGDLSIRALAHGDLDALLALYAELNPNDAPLPAREAVLASWQTILDDPKLHCLGGFVGTELACTCLLAIIPNLTRACRPYGLIENVVTTARHRRQGHARTLLRHAQALAWQQGCYKLMLLTGRKDDATLRFYESAGFDRHTKQGFYVSAPAAAR